jgi:radical SAM protein with 4Fe4S-binding SPASM domain
MIPYKQLSLADIFQDCQNKFNNDKPAFLSLLETHIDIDEFIPISFRNHFYASTGRSRKYPLRAFLWALIIQRIFSIPTDQLLLTFLVYSKPLRDFCGFTKVPDASKITRFKQDFLDDLQLVFDKLVDITEPICQAVDSAKADMTIFDSSGIEAFVTENNPKYANRIIRQLKAYAKANSFDKNYDPYKAAYGSMPSHASANPEIKQLYINGHFCYVFKFGIITNGLGIIRHIAFYNKNFIASHPDITVEKKSDSPDEDKSVHDSRLLIPTLKDFFLKHPLINPKTFLGDAAFDTAALYPKLLTGNTFGDHKHFDKAYIPLNSRAGLEKQDYTINENGIPEKWSDYLNSVLEYATEASSKTYINLRLWNAGVNASTDFNRFCLEKIAFNYDKTIEEITLKGKDSGIKLSDHIFLQHAPRFEWPDGEKTRSEATKTCYALRDQIAILVDGTVVPCCLDGDGNMNLGNIFNSDLAEILHTERSLKIRNGFISNQITEEFCKSCGFFIS